MITDEQVLLADNIYTGRHLLSTDLTAMRKALEAYEQSKWVRVGKEWNIPSSGQKVFLVLNGVRQEETYALDWGDSDLGAGEYWWSRDDLDGCPLVTENDYWQPLPEFKE